MSGYYNGMPPYGGQGMPYGGYISNGGYTAGAYYTPGTQLPYYAYYGQPVPSYGQIQPPSTRQHQPSRRGNYGGQRRPQSAGDGRPTSTRKPAAVAATSVNVACEICNLTFNNSAELADHVDGMHVHCEVEGCGYSAPVDLMSVHALKHVKNQQGEYVLESVDETRKWINNRRNRHPLNRHRDLSATEDSTLERLLRDAYRKVRRDAPTKSVLYPVISKVRPRPSALLYLSDPVKYQNLLRQSTGLYSYRASLSMGRAQCQSFKRTRTCKFGDNCNFSHNVQGGLSRDLSVTKRPPTLLHVLKNDIFKADQVLVSAIKTLVSLDFFNIPEEELCAADSTQGKRDCPLPPEEPPACQT
ncbi:nuclear fragile X mental retardation-interacting 1 [Babesia ovata]|uniref:Nuclear fragile X mental retardation-interacting 1 n=1 Tax=Babesia ovata TaxID=189622 RepID=A0A2H6KEZ2_9APIC|nr:nuclear fragile X mental retardation-interacting 1 [Babesia ovata]GBE61529.1 nuclear fragile X mental retardation-interacting 1 [Babesia ovata]